MTIGDIKQLLDISNEELLYYLGILEEKGFVSQWSNRKGQVALAKANLAGIKEANPPEYNRYTPS